jgi:hypothetical protein
LDKREIKISKLQMLTYLLECLLTPENTPPDCPKELYELYFVFACVWAFGGVIEIIDKNGLINRTSMAVIQ